MRRFRAGGPARIFSFTPSRGIPGSVGSVIVMDEMIGRRRAKVRCELVELVPGRTLVWQLRRPLFRLPVRLVLQLTDDDTGVQIEQSIEAGFSGAASGLDPVFRLLFPTRFAAAKDEHVRTEFPKLRDFLHQKAGVANRA